MASGVELATAWVRVVPSFDGVAKAIDSQLGAPLARAADRIGKNFADRFGDGLGSKAQKSWQWVARDLVAGFRDADAAASSFTGRAGSLGGAFRRGLDPGISAMQNFTSGFHDTNAAASSFTGVFGSLGGLAGKIAAPVTNAIGRFEGGFRDSNVAASSFSGILGSLGGAASRAWDAISASASTATSAVSRAWENIGPSVRSALSSVGEWAQNVSETASSALSRVSDALAGVGKVAAGIGIAGGVGAALFIGNSLTAGFDRLTTIEDATASLSITMGDAARAGDLLDDVMSVVTGTPYNYDQFASAASTLSGFGIAADKIPSYLTAIGEAAATKGSQANEFAQRLSTSFGQMAAIGQVSMNDVWSLSAVGVDALTVLGNAFDTSTADMRKMISDGAIPAEQAMDILTDAIMNGSEGAAGSTIALAGTMESLRETTSGVMGGMSSATARFGAAALEPLMPLIKDIAQSFTELLNTAAPLIASFVTSAIDGFRELSGWVQENWTWISLLGSVLLGAASAITVVVTAVKLVAAAKAVWAGAQMLLNVALNANPIGLIITAIGALVGAIIWVATQTTFFQDAWQAVSDFFVGLWENISGFFVTVWDTIVDLFFSFHPLGIIIDNWGPISDFLSGLWDTIVGAVRTAFDAIASVFRWVYDHVIAPIIIGIALYIAIWEAVLTWLWENAVRPVLTAIGDLFVWLYETVIQPVIDKINFAIDMFKLGVQVLWNEVIQPVLGWIGDRFTWLYENVIRPVVDGIALAIEAFKLGVQILWETAIQPILGWIADRFTWLHQSVIKPIGDGIQTAIRALGDVFPWIWNNRIKPIIEAFSAGFRAIHDRVVKPVGDGISNTVTRIGDTFRSVFSGIAEFVGAQFGRLADAVKVPLNALISLANSAIDALNGVSATIPDWVPSIGGQTFGLSIPKIPLLAGGATVRPRPGGTLAILAEAGKAETVVDEGKMNAILDQVLDGGVAQSKTFEYHDHVPRGQSVGQRLSEAMDRLSRTAW